MTPSRLMYLWFFLHLCKIIEDGNVEGRNIPNRIKYCRELLFSLSMVFIIIVTILSLLYLLLLFLFWALNLSNSCRNNNGYEPKNTGCVWFHV